jgi:hypothetical protein
MGSQSCRPTNALDLSDNVDAKCTSGLQFHMSVNPRNFKLVAYRLEGEGGAKAAGRAAVPAAASHRQWEAIITGNRNTL